MNFRNVCSKDFEAILDNNGRVGFTRFSGEESLKVFSDDGGELYLSYGVLHRIEGPAVMLKNGRREWWIGGKKHLEQDFRSIISRDELILYLLNGENF